MSNVPCCISSEPGEAGRTVELVEWIGLGLAVTSPTEFKSLVIGAFFLLFAKSSDLICSKQFHVSSTLNTFYSFHFAIPIKLPWDVNLSTFIIEDSRERGKRRQGHCKNFDCC